MKSITSLTLAAFGLACLPASAQLIGVEDFDSYSDGSIADLTGGTGWDYDKINNTTTGTVSDWDIVFGAPTVSSGTLITNNSGAKREYNGNIEGAGGGDGSDTERAGALRGNGLAFYKVDMTYVGGLTWGGLSTYDFGTERIYFGVVNNTDYGIGGAIDGGGAVSSGIPVDGATHTLIAVFDFDRDQVGLWVDPDGADYYYPPDGSNSCDAMATYTATNWNSAVRLASGAEVHWDNLSVAYDPLSIGLQDIIDVDGDMLPDPWETANGLDPTDDGTTDPIKQGANGDFDGDGLTNLQEFDGTGIAGFDGGTNPTSDDTDNDGLKDGDEITLHTTDPLNDDTDEDCLTDGAEVKLHGTDPLLVDTDGGGTSDHTEVALGTLPGAGESADDPPSNGDIDLIGLDSFDAYGDGPLNGKAGGTGFDYDNRSDTENFTGHSTKASDWTNVGGTPVIQGGRAVTLGTSIKREFHGGSNNPADVFGESAGAFRSDGGGTGLNNRDIVYAKVEVTRRAGADWGGLSLYNYGDERIFVGVNGTPSAFALQDSANGAASRLEVLDDFDNPINPVTDETNVIVAKFDFVLNEATMFVNPDLGAPEPEYGDPFTATINIPLDRMLGTGIRLGSGGSGACEWDKLAVGTTWESLSTLPADGDGDGLPGDWEAANGLDDTDDGTGDPNNGPDGDKDGDGLTNLEEYNLGSIANNDDTDGDGLTDGTGEMAAGTDPLRADTDGDGLEDGDEVNGNNPGSFTSDPLLADTDGDGQYDGGEVLGDPTGATSDPNDDTDTVGAPIGLIGCDGFFYSDGPIQDATGGEGFDYDNWFLNGPFIGHTRTTSDWDGNAVVAGGKLVTNNDTQATRDYNGPGEGPGSNEAPTDARLGAVNEGDDHDRTAVYFKAEMTRRAGVTASYIVSDDFGTWRMAFGVVDVFNDGTTLEWGIEEFGVGIDSDFGTTAVADDQTYIVVGKLDFAADLLSLWVDPDLNDTEANNTANVTRAYTGTNWSSGLRVNSKGAGDTEWDNVVVAHDWNKLNKTITEPAAPVAIIANGYNSTTGELSVTVPNLPAGDFHLRKSTDGQTFDPFPTGVDIDNTTPMPIQVPVDTGMSPTLLLRVYEGLSDPPG